MKPLAQGGNVDALEKMNKRREAATKGPWDFRASLDKRRGYVRGPHYNIADYCPENAHPVAAQKYANFDFIAHCRTDHERMAKALESILPTGEQLRAITGCEQKGACGVPYCRDYWKIKSKLEGK